nr:hypothetical protein [Halomonas saliphila]
MMRGRLFIVTGRTMRCVLGLEQALGLAQQRSADGQAQSEQT